jgi:ribosome maturation factor RimP
MERVGIPTLLFYMEGIKEKVTELAQSIAEQHGVHLVDAAIAGGVRRPLVRIFIDKDGGVTLDDCERFSRSLSALLDVEDPIPTSYVLEVSSPGLDRRLKTVKDFELGRGKLAKIILRSQIEGQNVYVGRIIDVLDGQVTIKTKDGQEVRIPFEAISKARLEIELK